MNVRTSTTVAVASLCLLVGGVLLAAPAALAVTPPAVEETSVLDVAGTSATLQATIDPKGSETTYRFEYGTSEAYGSRTPIPDGLVGSGSAGVTVSAHLQNLSSGTTYHYRVLALVASRGETVAGVAGTFTTQTVGGESGLPEGRQWELVSPVEKLGAQALPGRYALMQASEDGNAIAYYLSGPFVANAPGNDLMTAALSRRGPGGWSTEDIATPHNEPGFSGTGAQEYELFSSDLSRGVVVPYGETPLSPETTERTPYLRDDATGTYTPLVTAANVPPGTKFGQVNDESVPLLNVLGASRDMSHIVLQSPVPLTSNAHGLGIYDWSAGHIQLIVSESEFGGASEFGGKVSVRTNPGETYPVQGSQRGAVSNDGSRIFWTPSVSQVSEHLDMTDTATGEEVQLDKAQGIAEPPTSNTEFQIASGDGSVVFFGDSAQLTTSPGGGLYAYDVATGKLTLVTVSVHSGEKPNVRGMVLGAAEDGSYVYLVAGGLLTEAPNSQGEKAVAGGDNLYVLHREVNGAGEQWAPAFIAGLSAGDEPDWDPREGNITLYMGQLSGEVAGNGQHVAFMSDRSLTHYDNRDASSGEPDEEVYEYSAPEARLVCVSCDQTGARPSGWFEGPELNGFSDIYHTWLNRWVAASIPGYTEVGLLKSLQFEPRYVLDNGLVFFDSRDALVPQDVNGVGDVYEHRPDGVGGCAAVEGCVSLISGGTGAQESAFVDTSASGSDVFFVTADQLAPQDVDSSFDMYDAHVCSAQAPCPVSVVSPPPCDTADACKGAPPAQPALFGAPASSTFSGAGNVKPVAPKTTTGVKKTSKPKQRVKRRKHKTKIKTRHGAKGSRARGAASRRAGR